jgi:Uma2 family endonuclease
MTVAQPKLYTLTEFLQLPETEPASEFIHGQIFQKPMPKGKHSRLQLKLCAAINQVTEGTAMALALPELRCTFAERSLVSDIAVFRWDRIPFDTDGEVSNTFEASPDWVIEIQSPGQSQTKLTDKLLFCLQHGTQLGWLIDPEERAVICYTPDGLPSIRRGVDSLPVLAEVEFPLTAEALFGWLKPEIFSKPS